MRNAPVTSRLTRWAGALLVGLLAASCGSGGGGGTSNPDNPQALKVVYVTSHRRDNWMRNEPVEIWFSAPLSKASLQPGIIERALQISIVTSSGRVPAKGCFSFATDERGNERRDRVKFDPTRVTCDSQGCADNPFGFQPLTTYDIFIPTPSQSKKFLTSTAGDPIVEGYDSFFTTGEAYLREVEQPRFTGTDGQGSLGFDPPRKLNGEVVFNARVLIVFDDAMDPTTFDNGTTITVRNETLTALQGTPVLVPGNFVPDLCGRTWRFSPSFSFGGAGYDIGVILTSGLKDLSGNPLGNPQTIRFRTEVKAGVPTTQVINESFDLQTFMDTANTTADWGVTTTGTLQGGAVTSQDVIVALQTSQYPGGVRTRVRDHPFYDGTSPSLGKVGHEQWVYTQAELGTSAAITQVGWGPSSNALFASNHQRVQVTLGHTQGDALSTNMPNNFDVGIPVKVADSSYVIPQRATIDPPCGTDGCAVGYWPLPTFTNFFEYNGKNNVIVDIDASIGSNYQITRVFFGPVGFPSRNTFGNTGDTTGSLLQPLVQDMKFTKKRRTTVAQSLFYDSGQSNPDYATPILSPVVQTGGTSIEVGYEGAEGILFPIPSNPNNVIPDPTTYTGFVTNLDQLDSYRFIRFRIIFTSNVNTGQVPTLQSLSIPYIF
ncbi:MAG TPA: Ig-like domain-containing protein [Planctomycetota bacterium]|nr:Ig-like domain-containing protein [Planctomycetota bacterium]